MTVLRDKEELYKSDHKKFDEYLVNLNNLVTKREAEIEKQTHEMNNLSERSVRINGSIFSIVRSESREENYSALPFSESVIAAQEKCVEGKEKLVKAQNISQHDIDRMRMEKEELQRQIGVHLKEAEEHERQINERQIEAAQMNSQVGLFDRQLPSPRVRSKSHFTPNSCFRRWRRTVTSSTSCT